LHRVWGGRKRRRKKKKKKEKKRERERTSWVALYNGVCLIFVWLLLSYQ
jgi:predicted nucleic acid-binding Zn ribbon protein